MPRHHSLEDSNLHRALIGILDLMDRRLPLDLPQYLRPTRAPALPMFLHLQQPRVHLTLKPTAPAHRLVPSNVLRFRHGPAWIVHVLPLRI
jgi:hypothetical protein